MSLINLLSLGRSFVGMKSQASRYKVIGLDFMPKFVPALRPSNELPVAALPKPDAPAADLLLPFAELSAPTAQPGIPVIAADPVVPSPVLPKTMAKRPAPIAPSAPDPLRARRNWNWKWTWPWAKSNPFRVRSATRQEKPVQEEMSLQSVRVVRNDLHDADLEILSAAAAGQGGARSLGTRQAWMQTMHGLRQRAAQTFGQFIRERI